MKFRDYITNETSAFVERLVAASETATEQVRLDADNAISQLRDQAEGTRAQLETEIARGAVLAAQLDAATARAAGLGAQLDTETSRNASLAAQLDAESKRAAALAADLDSESSRSASLLVQLDAATARAVALAAQLDVESSRNASLTTQLESETSRNASLAAQLDAETARAAALAADLDASAAALRKTEEAWRKAEATVEAGANELRGVRELVESARAEATRMSEALEIESAQKVLLQQAHETIVRDLEAQAESTAANARALESALAEAEAGAREAAVASETQLQGLQAQLEQQAEMLRTRDARLEAAEASLTSMRAEVDEANAITDATSAALSTLREHMRRVTTMLNRSAASLAALQKATTVDGIFSTLVRELATEFERVAIFRVKGNHLEGDLAAGLDDSIDIKKIVIPRGLDSLITKAAAGGGLELATQEQISESRPPFGGSPASALAAPLVLEGEVLAVAYADSDSPFTDAHGPFAGVLARHANALLARLAQELKVARQLREYARMLLRDAEAMFVADLEAGLTMQDRLRRLRGSIEFAHDLYAQRAALEGVPSSHLLDEEVTAIVGTEPLTPFASELAAIVEHRQARRTAS